MRHGNASAPVSEFTMAVKLALFLSNYATSGNSTSKALSIVPLVE